MACRGSVVRNERREAISLRGGHYDVTADIITDPITGLPNQILLLDRVSHAIARVQHHGEPRQFGIVLIQVQRIGRPQQDDQGEDMDLLAGIARRLERCLRVRDAALNDDLVVRAGGDQFAILLDALPDVADAKILADRILSDLRAPFPLNGSQVFLTVSMGIAVSATGYRDADDMVRDAESACHRARMLGGLHSQVFDTAALTSCQTERQLAQDLPGALQRQEFRLVYQPIFALTSHGILGFEALVRWQHPTLGTISPSEFIPLAERSGFIVSLGAWIVQQACERLKDWRDRVPGAAHVWMSMNVSSVQLRHATLTHQIAEALSSTGLDARSLVLELTEGVAIDNPAETKTVLMQLRARGIRISIDDFGTGYSSLAYLRELPVDMLKIDQSFVRGIEQDTDKAAIVDTVIKLAQQLGLEVVVEGIENDGQLAAISGAPFDAVQGFLLAKPLEEDAVLEMLSAGPSPHLSGVREMPSALLTPQARRPLRDAGAPLGSTAKWLGVAASVGVLGVVGASGVWLTHEPRKSSPESQRTARTSGLPSVASQPSLTPDVPPGVPTTETPTASSASSSSVEKPPALATRVRPTMTSLPVEHLHRLGNCHGHLRISPRGLEFIPDPPTQIDAFSLKYSEFLASLDGNATLRIKSQHRTYRFRTVATKGDAAPRLSDFILSIEEFRTNH
jgi:diguanylate cyclase (GGDEF)-like protein